jgi:hypothetical protein
LRILRVILFHHLQKIMINVKLIYKLQAFSDYHNTLKKRLKFQRNSEEEFFFMRMIRLELELN